MPERPRALSRREFLGFALYTTGAAFKDYLFPPFLFLKGPKPINTWGAEFEFRNGVYVSGESKVFEYKGQKIRASVNERAFMETLTAIAEVHNQKERLRSFLEENPLYISLHAKQIIPFVDVGYTSPDAVKRPEIQFTTKILGGFFNFIKSYPEDVWFIDSIMAHELWHVWQFAEGRLPKIDRAIRSVIVSAPTSLGFVSGARNSEVDDDRKLLENVTVGTLKGLAVGGVINVLLPSILELDAYTQSGKIMDLPQLAHHRGNFLYFDEVTG